MIAKFIKFKLFLFVVIAFSLLAFLLPPVSQPESFHHFADTRSWLGIPNAGNVLSNLAFLIVAIYGISFYGRKLSEKNIRISYLTVFTGLLFTSIGSAYYHWQPDSDRLVWDRLPMTMIFMPLLVSVIAERINVNVTLLLLLAIFTGIFTVVYWKYSGNLIPYFTAQYGCIFLLLLSTFLFPTKGDKWLYCACISYGIAMLCERFDREIFYTTGRIVNGHTVKHIVAALAFCFIIYTMNIRRYYPKPDRA